MPERSEHMTDEQRRKIAVAVKTLGASEVARRMRLSTEAILQLAVGARSQEGTELLAVQRLASLDANAGDASPIVK